jgi:threonine/homoserine/homoserine lactone efflux protein
VAAFACTLGIEPQMIAAVMGLAAIMYASALAFSVIKWLGVGYLLYLPLMVWLSVILAGRLAAQTR